MSTQTPAGSKRTKLMVMVTNFHIGGTERQVANLALRIDPSRFDLHLACLKNSGELLKELEGLAVPRPEFRIGSLHALRTLWQAIRLSRYIRKHGIQIVHSYGFYPNVFAMTAAKLAGNVVAIASIRDMGDGLTPLQTKVQRRVCRWANCVLVNADAIRQRLISQGYRPNNIVVIPNGITLTRYNEQQAGILRREFGLPPSSQVVVVFSRLNQMKGVQYFLDAAAIVARRFPGVRFLVAGDGANKKELEEKAERMGLGPQTVFAGFRCDVREWLPEADVSVLPSLSEGLSNSLLESMASGVPVIGARVGGNPEVIDHEVTGLLVPPKDANALANAMCRLLADKEMAARFGQAGRRRVAELFSVDGSVRQTTGLYRRLVESGAQA